MCKYLLIPASNINPIDNIVNTITEQRLLKGLMLFKGGEYDKIIITGGIYYPKSIQTIPAGDLMAAYLDDYGINPDSIICENEALDGYDKIFYPMELINEDINPKITVVTDWLNAIKFRITFYRVYNMKIDVAPVDYPIGLKNFILECCRILYRLIDKKGVYYLAVKNRQKLVF